jgi:homoserine O-acetyltransferase
MGSNFNRNVLAVSKGGKRLLDSARETWHGVPGSRGRVSIWGTAGVRASPGAACGSVRGGRGNAQQFADLGDFKLLSGAIIRNRRLGYRIQDNLNAQKSNGVLWSTWLGGTTKDLLPNAAPGNVVDTRKYFAILVDAIGNGISSSPSNTRNQPLMRFPEFTMRDIVNAEHELVTTVLKIPHLHAVVGISMGGMQTFEWMAAYPDFMDEAIAITGSAQSTSFL